MRRLLAQHPPAPESEVLWFETPSVLDARAMSVAAYARLGPAMDSFGTEEPCVWPTDQDRGSLADWDFEVPELDALCESSGWLSEEKVSEAEAEAALRNVMLMSHACALLLVLNGLPRTDLGRSLTCKQGVTVLMGWKSGGVMAIGTLREGAWGPVRRVRGVDSPAILRYKLDPTGPFMFSLNAYLRAGLDLEARTDDGRTVLLCRHYDEPKDIRKLIDAGADVRARDAAGNNVLHLFGACELETLGLLIAKGADPSAVNKSGVPVWHSVVRDGRCRLAHLRLLEKHGADIRSRSRDLSPAICRMADGGLLHRKRPEASAMLRYFIARGHDPNRRDAEGRTALWRTLEHYANQVAHRWQAQADIARGSLDDYGYDRFAALLLEHGADANTKHARGRKPLIPAGATPLMVRRYDSDLLVRALLKYGADPHARCKRGKTALDYARLAARRPQVLGHEGAPAVVAVLERAMRRGSEAAKRGKPRR